MHKRSASRRRCTLMCPPPPPPQTRVRWAWTGDPHCQGTPPPGKVCVCDCPPLPRVLKDSGPSGVTCGSIVGLTWAAKPPKKF